MNVKIKIRKGYEDCEPEFMTSGSSGMDLKAAVSEDVIIEAGAIQLIPCGFYIQIPKGYEAQIRSKSGLALKHKTIVFNSPGTIDSDYRGEVSVILYNCNSYYGFIVYKGQRIAQMIFNKIEIPTIQLVDKLDNTKRGEGGFGSTGND